MTYGFILYRHDVSSKFIKEVMNMGIALITGSSRGIGRATALKMAHMGHKVIVTYKSNMNAANEVVDAIEACGGSAIAIQLDITKLEKFDVFINELKRQLLQVWQVRSLDYLINNAGVGGYGMFRDVSEQYFDEMYLTHFKGPYFLTQALISIINDEGVIVNLSSATTRTAFEGTSTYASFKGAVEVWTRCLAKELGSKKIRVNSVSPGAIATDLIDLDANPEFKELLIKQTALGRLGKPNDVGDVIAQLVSSNMQWVNGQNIEIAGGFNL